MALAGGQTAPQLYSQAWYRVAGLRPRLRGHIHIQRQVFRGQEWYVLHDHLSGRFHRITPEAYFIIGLMDGARSMADIWAAAALHLGESLPTQEEILSLLAHIHRFDGLQSDFLPDMTELSERTRQEKRGKVLSYLASPISLRLPLLDPDTFLTRTVALVRPLFGWFGGLLWLAVVVYGLLLAGVHWDALSANVTDRVLSLENVLLLSLVYPLCKAVHEFAHAYAVKHWGGEVHEMGIMFLVFVPIPYVDATAAHAFCDKKQRMLVGAAGILVELFLAALAMVVWANAGPGAVRAVAYAVMIIGGVSTLLMNGNPLIRYDAYYILADFLELPNLAARSSQYLGYFVKRRLLFIREAVSPAVSLGEACWLAGYGVASFVYRLVIMTAIMLFVAGKFFVVGILLALWTLLSFIVLPLKRLVPQIMADAQLRGHHGRGLLAGGLACALVLAVVAGVRIPSFTVVEGVVWLPIESQVNAGADGFVVRLLAAPDSVVRRGDPLIQCEAPRLEKEVRLLKGVLVEAEARYQLSQVSDRAAAEVLREEMAKARADLKRALERLDGLLIRSPADGVFLLPLAEDLAGRFVKKGAGLGNVVDFAHAVVRIVVDQDDVELIRNRTRRIEARLASELSRGIPATMARQVPAASHELPSLALSVSGGGSIALDPSQNNKPQSFRKNFLFDVDLSGTTLRRVGERAFVRFDHPPETVAMRLYRNIRRVLIKRFAY